jgi:WD40 repeat protein
VCAQEIDHAVANNKRLMPIVRREGFDMDLVRPALGKHNWLFFREEDDFDAAFQSLIQALNTDLGYIKDHTRLLVRALEWDKKQRRDDLLLRGDDLKEAEGWLDNALQATHEPLPSEQHKTYIHKSREVEDANQRLTEAGEKAKRLVRIGAGVLAGTVAIATVIGIMTQRQVVRLQQLAQLEQDGINALRQFEFQEMAALLQAMQAAEELKRLKGGGDKPLSHYTSYSPPWILQQMLDQIRQKNLLTKNDGEPSTDTKAQFSPDGELLVITSTDRDITLKTIEGLDVITLEGHTDKVYQAEFSPDGQTIVSASEDETFHVWKKDGTLLNVLEHPSKNSGRIRFSPDSQYLAISGWGEDGILLLDSEGNQISSIPGNRVFDVVFSPDSQLIASTSANGTLEIWDLQGNLVSTLTGHNTSVYSVKFSPDGNYLVSGSADQTVRLWDLATNQSTTIADLNGTVYGVDFHPDGQYIAAGSSGGVAGMWDLDGNWVDSFSGHQGRVNSVAFSPNGNTLITTSGDIFLWSLEDKATLNLETGALWNAAFSPDGKNIWTASIDNDIAQVWDLEGKELSRLELPNQRFTNIVYSPDGQTIVTATYEGDLQVWNSNGDLTDTFDFHSRRILGLKFSPDGQMIASGSSDGTAKLWDLDGTVWATVQYGTDIRDVAFSPNGESFAIAAEGPAPMARLYDLDGQLLTEFKGHVDGVNSVDFHPSGTQLVTSSDDSTVKIWNVDGNLITSFQKHRGRVWSVKFSPDGNSIATGASDGYARIWDMNGNLTHEFKGHDDPVSSVNFSPDGISLLTTSFDGTTKVWTIAQTLDDLLREGCDWLEDYFESYPERLAEFRTCQSK